MGNDKTKPQLRIGTGWTEVEVETEPYVVFTRRGYAPVVDVSRSGLTHILYVSAISLAEKLEDIRDRRGSLAGLQLRLKKEDNSQFSPYVVEEI